MPKVSFVTMSGDKYFDDIIFQNYNILSYKLKNIYDKHLNNEDFIIIKMIFNNKELNFGSYCQDLYGINYDIIIYIVRINLLANIEDTEDNRLKIRKIINLEYRDEYIIRNINKFKNILVDEIITKIAIYKYKIFINYIDFKFRDNEDVMLIGINKYYGDPNIFNYISDRLKNDINFIMKAIKNNGSIYKYIDEKFKNNEEIIIHTLKNEKKMFEYITNDFKNNKEIILKLIKSNLIIFKLLPIKLKLDKDILLESINNNLLDSTYFEYFKYSKYNKRINNDSEQILDIIINDRKILFELIKKDNMMFIYVCAEYNNDIEFLEEIIIKTPHLIELSSNEIKNNRNLILKFIKINSKIFYNDDIYKLYNNDREIILEVIKDNPKLLKYASIELKNDPEIKQIALDNYLNEVKIEFLNNIIENK